MGLSVPFVFRDCKGIGRVMMEKQAWLSQNISVFHQKVNVRDYLSVLTISLSNLVNCISLLRPVVKSSYVSRMLLLKIKFFQRNSGECCCARHESPVLQTNKDLFAEVWGQGGTGMERMKRALWVEGHKLLPK